MAAQLCPNKKSGTRQFRWWLLLIVVSSLCGYQWQTRASPLRAQDQTVSGQWAVPQRIPGYGPESSLPVLVADQDQTIHAFSSQWVDDELVAVYSQWTPERGWTIPVDIILPPLKRQIRVSSIVLSDEGVFHMAFFAGDEIEANIYYAQAPAPAAGRATAWSAPVNIGPVAIAPTVSEIKLLQSGELVLVYSGRSQGQGLYAAYSFDLGQAWTLPEPFFLTYDNELWPTPLELYEDSNGRLHALWGLVDTRGHSLAIYYSRLDEAQKQWSIPTVLAEAIDYVADKPAIIEHDDQLIVIYHNNRPMTRWMQRSFDGGDTWTDPVRLFAHEGSNGPAALVEDSGGLLHMFFGNRVGNPAIHGMWHTIWQPREQRWQEPQPVVSGRRVQGPIGGNGFDPSHARSIIVQGNILLLTWLTDPGAGRNGVWFTETRLDSPLLPRQPLPAPSVTPTAISLDETSVPNQFDTEIDPGFEQDQNTSQPDQTSYAQIVLASTLLPGLFIMLVLAVFGFHIRNRAK
jgi:hypothetical protein